MVASDSKVASDDGSEDTGSSMQTVVASPSVSFSDHHRGSPCSRRTKFTSEALELLKEVYERDPTPSGDTRNALATVMGVTPRKVQVWFQNRRQRQKARGGAKAELEDEGSDDGKMRMMPATPSQSQIFARDASCSRALQALSYLPASGAYAQASQAYALQQQQQQQAYAPSQERQDYAQMQQQQQQQQYSASMDQSARAFGAAAAAATAMQSCHHAAAAAAAASRPVAAASRPVEREPMRRNGTCDSLADLAEVAGMAELLDRSGSYFDLASIPRSTSLADLVTLSRNASLADLASLSRNASLADLATVAS